MRIIPVLHSNQAAQENLETAWSVAATGEITCRPGRRRALRGEVLWRLRRATTMETGLLEIQAEHLRDYRQTRQLPSRQGVIHAVLGQCASIGRDRFRHLDAADLIRLNQAMLIFLGLAG